ncbi:MAG: SHOCT domain-containing protein [Lachnospiraceae bacterium]|nr:SHOCT domain-containing protein [Lachnospiraceae bacterium]
MFDMDKKGKNAIIKRTLEGMIGSWSVDSYDKLPYLVYGYDYGDAKDALIELNKKDINKLNQEVNQITVDIRKSVGDICGRVIISEEFDLRVFGYINSIMTNSPIRCYNFNYNICFAYHQNSIMEEIYNYIQKRQEIMNAPDYDPENDIEEEEEEVVETTIGEDKTNNKTNNETQENTSETINPAFLLDDEKTEKDAEPPISIADEIKKFKELYDLGVISEEEFNEAKKRLMMKL